VRPEEAPADVYAQLKNETSEKIPSFSDIKLFREGDEFSGPWEAGHFRFRHKSLPPQAGPAPKSVPAPAQKAKPIKCGVWNGTSFIPTRAIDLSITREERTRIIKEAFDIGDDYRFFVYDTEVRETELKAGHQYSIYPLRFERVPDPAISSKDKTPALRTEGPMIGIQCIVLSEARASVMLRFSVKVPEEISLAQLWHRHVANRVKRHIETVKWGKHFRGSAQIEEETVPDLADKDSIEIIIPAEPAPTGQLEVVYNLEGESAVNRFTVKSTATMGDVRSRISKMHKGKPIRVLTADDGSEFQDEDNFSDWMFRSGGMPRQIVAKVQPMVQVILDYMGVEKQMTVRKGISKVEFLAQAKTFLATSHNLEVIAHTPGDWEIRAGSVYEIRETRQLTLKCKDQDNRDFVIKIQGTKNIEDLQELCRQYWGYGPWIHVAISRLDGKQFFLQDGALYSVVSTYDPAADPRPEVTLRIDLRDWSYLIPKFRVEDDPQLVIKALKTKYGFPFDKSSRLSFSSGPWRSGETVCITTGSAVSCAKVTLPQYLRRTFSLHIADEPWESGEVVLPREFEAHQIWAHLQTLHSISDLTQFQVVSNRK
jgi:hypothetical protein